MRKADQRLDGVVVGAGVVGFAAALGLARAGYRTMLVGAQNAGNAGAAWDPRVYALSPAAQRLLERLGAWAAIDGARVAPVYDMRVYPVPASAVRDGDELHLSAAESAQDALAWIVEERNLLGALATAARIAGVERVGADLRSLELGADRPDARVALADGTLVSASLVVGADGASSATRQAAGIRAEVHEYPQCALVCNLATPIPHRDCAWQWFGPHGVLALLPLPPDTGVSVVWSAPRETADEVMALAAVDRVRRLATEVSRISAALFDELSPMGEVRAFPLRRLRVESVVGERLALVGDAAHVVHPLAGQGLNLGLGDVAALLDALAGDDDRRRRVDDPGERRRLRRYARARAEPVAAMRITTDALQRLFDASGPAAEGPLAAVRRLGWRTVARSALLRRQLVAQAGA